MGRRLLELLRIILSEGIREGDALASRTWLEPSLIERGYSPEELELAYQWIEHAVRQNDAGKVGGMETTTGSAPTGARVPVLTLAEKAHSFLTSLKDLGLVDDQMEEEILNRLMMTRDAEISLEDMKRTAAIVIFERQFDANEEYFGIFEEEWKLLFN